MTKTTYHFAFQSQVANIKKVLGSVLTYINNDFPDLNEDMRTELRLIFSELLINAVIHGNQEDPHKWVRLSITFAGNDIMSVIRDEGLGFDYEYVLRSELHLCEYDNMVHEHGRGLRIVHSLVDSMRFNSSGNEIMFSKKIA